jgi:hypothetical protein
MVMLLMMGFLFKISLENFMSAVCVAFVQQYSNKHYEAIQKAGQAVWPALELQRSIKKCVACQSVLEKNNGITNEHQFA